MLILNIKDAKSSCM